MTMSDDGDDTGGRRFGKAGWVIVGGIGALGLAFAAVAAFGPTLFPGSSQSTGPETETAQESATSGPGHNTSSVTQPTNSSFIEGGPESSELQIPDSELSYGRETSTQETPDSQAGNP